MDDGKENRLHDFSSETVSAPGNAARFVQDTLDRPWHSTYLEFGGLRELGLEVRHATSMRVKESYSHVEKSIHGRW